MAEENQKELRGREATSPTQIPPVGWKDIVFRAWREIQNDRVSFIAAGIAFYLLFAMVPGLAALISIYGLVSDPIEVGSQLSNLRGVIPDDTITLIEGELVTLTSQTRAAGWSLFISLVVTTYSGSKAIGGIITGLNIAYGERDKRGFIRKKIVSLGMTFASLVFLAITLVLLVAVPIVLRYAGLESQSELIIGVIRWPILAAVTMVWLAFIYRVGPDREPPRWKWVTWGSILAVVVWFLISVGLSVYASSFADLQKTYGSLGAIVLLMLWFYGFGWAIIAGAELNAEIERQTMKDSTTGPPEPMGKRGAFAADTLGDVRGSGEVHVRHE